MIRRTMFVAAVAGACLFGVQAVEAQSVRHLRIDPHPVGGQVGIVTSVSGKTAWVRMPERVQAGDRIEFSAFSDGADILAAGRVDWVAPIAPYEAYIADIKIVKTSHPVSEFGDLLSVAFVTGKRAELGAQPLSDGMAVALCAGFYARAKTVAAAETEAVEPVRANIAALRSRKGKAASVIADAAEKALRPDPLLFRDDQPADFVVDFSALSDMLRPFKRLRIDDPITAHLLVRLNTLASDSGAFGARVASDFLRPSDQLLNQNGSGQNPLRTGP